MTAGHPSLELTRKLVDILVESGADMIELGIPFSDPIADGPVIQSAVQMALENRTTPPDVLRLARDIKDRHDLPLALLSYYNPIYRLGVERFCRTAARSRVDGLIVADLPYEEAGDLRHSCSKFGIDTILLASPSTTPNRLREISQASSGFLYLVSVYGTTGERKKLAQRAPDLIRYIVNAIEDRLPVAAGFGISRPLHVQEVLRVGAKGAIVGSALVRLISDNYHSVSRLRRKVRSYTSQMKKATRLLS